MSLAKDYAETIHDEWEELYANWPVDLDRKLGDYGILDHGIFRKLGNISDSKEFNIKEAISKDTNDAIIEYKSSDSVKIKFHSKGAITSAGIQLANAGVEMSFGSENSFYFKAAKGIWEHYKSPAKLGAKIMDIYDKDNNKWQRNWVVLTDMLKAEATTIIATKGSNASIILQAKGGDIPSIDLADASLGFSIQSESNIGLKVIASKGMIPLLGFMKIQRKSLLGLGIIPIGTFWGPEK